MIESVDRAQGPDDDIAAESTSLEGSANLAPAALVDGATAVQSFEEGARRGDCFVLLAGGERVRRVRDGLCVDSPRAKVGDDPHAAVMRTAMARSY